MEKQDIFDKIMEFPLFSVFQPIYRKYKEILLYLQSAHSYRIFVQI